MTASAHLAVGAASALFTQRYIPVNYGVKGRYCFGFGAAIVSHMILDSIPHPEYSVEGQALMSLIVMEGLLISAILLFGQTNPITRRMIVLGIIGGALPDGLYFANYYTGWDWLLPLHNILHITHGMLSWMYANYYVQVPITLFAVFYVRIKSAR